MIPFNNKYMIFIDGSNLFHACQRKGIKMDFEKLKEVLTRDKNVINIYYYTGVTANITAEQSSFFKKLKHLEYKLNTKTLKLRSDGIKVEKGIDVLLAIDLLWYAFHNAYDTAILVSGDDDFVPAVNSVISLGRRVELWTFEDSLGKEIGNLVDKKILLDDFIQEISRREPEPP